MWYAQQTQHPQLFLKVYWGWFGKPRRDKDIDRELFANRDRMVDEFQLLAVTDEPPIPRRLLEGLPTPPIRRCILLNSRGVWHGKETGRVFDHIEVYRTPGGGRFLLTSPYQLPDSAAVQFATAPQSAGGLGMRIYPRVYDKAATSLIITFKDVEALKLWIVHVWRMNCKRSSRR